MLVSRINSTRTCFLSNCVAAVPIVDFSAVNEQNLGYHSHFNFGNHQEILEARTAYKAHNIVHKPFDKIRVIGWLTIGLRGIGALLS